MHKKIPTYIKKSGHTLLLVIASLLFIMVLFYSAFFVGDTGKAKAGTANNLSGWAWSGDDDPNNNGLVDDNNEIGGIGWISFNCTNTNSCSTVDYGVDIATNGDLSGYAWYGWEDSDGSVVGGWISFNESDLLDCPSGACKAKLAGNNLQGWARALSFGDDWDGWISLNGATYGVTKNGNNLEEYAWDASDIDGQAIGIGWINFNPLVSEGGGVVITPDNAPTVNLSANPTAVLSGEDSTLTWTSTNATECTSTVGSADWLADSAKALSGTEVVGPHTVDTVYRLTCTNAIAQASDDATVLIEIPTQCSDEIDNDGDGQTDYPDDTSCSDGDGDNESIPVCGNTKCETGENSFNCSTDCGTPVFEEF